MTSHTEQVQDPTEGDTPTHRRSLEEMTNEELLALIDAKRELFNKAKTKVHRYRSDASKINSDKLHTRYIKKVQMLEKELLQVDKLLNEKLTKRMEDIQLLRLQLFGDREVENDE